MCRNITPLRGLEPPASTMEIEAAALQYVRKVGALQSVSARNDEAVQRAVAKIAAATAELLADLPPRQQPPQVVPPLRRRAAGSPTAAATSLRYSPGRGLDRSTERLDRRTE